MVVVQPAEPQRCLYWWRTPAFRVTRTGAPWGTGRIFRSPPPWPSWRLAKRVNRARSPPVGPVFHRGRPRRPLAWGHSDKCSAFGPPICNRYLSGVR